MSDLPPDRRLLAAAAPGDRVETMKDAGLERYEGAVLDELFDDLGSAARRAPDDRSRRRA